MLTKLFIYKPIVSEIPNSSEKTQFDILSKYLEGFTAALYSVVTAFLIISIFVRASCSTLKERIELNYLYSM